MGRIYSSCGELENWLGELLDCCSFSSYSPAKSLWEGFCREVWVMECVCHGQEHLRTARIAQAEQKSKQCLQHEQEMLVACRKVFSALCLKWWCAVFSTNESFATASGAEAAGTEMQPHGHLLNHKTQIFQVLQCLQALFYSSSCDTSSRMSFLCLPKVWQSSCVMQGESFSIKIAEYLLTLSHMLERRDLETLRERGSQVSWSFFQH